MHAIVQHDINPFYNPAVAYMSGTISHCTIIREFFRCYQERKQTYEKGDNIYYIWQYIQSHKTQ